jgi:hypothetical protein
MYALTMLRGLTPAAGRGLAAASLLALACFAGPLRSHDTFASIGFCRSDPIILLSNGHLIQVGARIGDDASDVQQVTYHVSGPAGAKAVRIYNIDAALSGKTTVDYSDSDAQGSYDSEVLVTTGAPGVAVTAESFVTGVGFGTASGLSGQDLTIHLAK